MRIRLGVPSDLNRDETAGVLDAALEAVTAANEPLIARGKVPDARVAIKRHGVKWRPEPPGDEHFDLASTVLRRGHGDCDDLAPYLAASLRASGEDPEAYAYVRPTGPNRWHAVVHSQGHELDPSRWAGMGARVSGDDGVHPAFWDPMFAQRMTAAAYPTYRGWGARLDVPEAQLDNDIVWSHMGHATDPATAMRAAIHGALALDRCEGDNGIILAGIADLLAGVPPEMVDEALESQGCVGFLPFLAPMAASLAAPLIKKATDVVAPMASSVLSKGMGMFGGGGGGGGGGSPTAAAAAAPGFHGGGGGYVPGSTMHVPNGPIIIRF